MRIIKSFEDFYDDCDIEICGTYDRTGKEKLGRMKELKMLRDIGIETISLRQVRDISTSREKLIVYTDSHKHNGKGKIVVSTGEARMMYNNYLSSEYINDTEGYSMKYIQIGERRFNVTFRNRSGRKLEHGEVVSIREVKSGYHDKIKIPIFSIDYIPIGRNMIATDFNMVQELGNIGMEKYISKREVAEEIDKALKRVR